MKNYEKYIAEFCSVYTGTGTRKLARLLEEGYKGMYSILRILNENKTETLAGDLAKRLDISTARIAVAIKNLEQKGYVKRKKADDDKRKVVVELLPKGEAALHAREEKLFAVLTEYMQKLTDEELACFLSVSKKMFE